jgi:hypothetical protein
VLGWSDSPAARRDTSAGNSDGGGTARYDLVAGTLDVSASSGPSGQFQAHVIARDRYVVLGPVCCPPAPFHARLHVTGTVEGFRDPGFGGGTAAIWAVLEEPATGNRDSVRVDAGPGVSRSLDAALQITLSKATGESFELALGVHAGCSFGFGAIHAELGFDVPAGVELSSCQGYAGSGSVPAARTTWGSLKSLYRDHARDVR